MSTNLEKPEKTISARCVNCRSEIVVHASDAHGDQVPCPECHTSHKVVRTGEVVKVVMADVAGLKESVAHNRELTSQLEAELKDARASFGIGANGLGIGVLYAIAKVGLEEQPLSQGLLVTAALIAVGSGLLLEVANFMFLAKRSKIRRLAGELAQARQDGKELQRKLRDAQRA